MIRFGAALLAALFLAAPSAHAATVGNTVIDRVENDSFSDFSVAFTDLVLPTTTITEASLFGDVAGDVAILILSQSGSTFTVEAEIEATIVAGSVVTVSGLSIPVQMGWILGLYQGDGRVDYDNVGALDTPFQNSESGRPSVGNAISISRGPLGRDYSLSVTTVPVPAALPALGLGLGTLAALGRRRRSQRA